MSIGGAVLWLLLQRTTMSGQRWWVAHCLNVGILSQGTSIEAALMMIQEQVQMAAMDDHEAGLCLTERSAAPDEEWEKLHEVLRSGYVLPREPGEQCETVVAQLVCLQRPGAAEPYVVVGPLKIAG
jgi:hypothetical protein